MLHRLIFSLLLACLALPATTTMPCHDGGAEAAMTMQTGKRHHHDPAMAAHACIGCVPPSSWRTAPDLAPPLMIPAAPPVAVLARLDLGRAMPPATPPPRRAA
jgi:hypothetical protein